MSIIQNRLRRTLFFTLASMYIHHISCAQGHHGVPKPIVPPLFNVSPALEEPVRSFVTGIMYNDGPERKRAIMSVFSLLDQGSSLLNQEEETCRARAWQKIKRRQEKRQDQESEAVLENERKFGSAKALLLNCQVQHPTDPTKGIPLLSYLITQKNDQWTWYAFGCRELESTADSDNRTPLMYAIEAEDQYLARRMIATKNIDVTIKAANGDSALALATRKNQPFITGLIMEKLINQVRGAYLPDKCAAVHHYLTQQFPLIIFRAN